MNRIFQNVLIGLFISVFAIFLFPTSSISAAVNPGCYDSNTSTSTDKSCIGKKDTQGNVITANTTNCYLKNGTTWQISDCAALGIAQTPAGNGAAAASTSATLTSNDPGTVCAAGGGAFSWIVCPLINMFSGIEQWFIKIINSQLSTPPLTLTNGNGPSATISKNLHKVWDSFRFFGNMVLIIAILLIAYSEAVGGSLSDAYTVQKTLPRILLGVILINLSFYIMAGLMDIFNVFGTGIFDLIIGPFRSATDNVGIINYKVSGFGANAAGVFGTGGVTLGLVLGGAALLAADAVGLIISALLLTFSAFLAFFGIMITILIRQGIIVFLLLSSPIAFALYILPNTEQYFKKWWGLAIKTFMVYPIIEAIIAMAFVLGWILSQLGTTNSIDKFLAIVATLAPLFLIPYAFKISGGVIGAVYGQVNKALSAPRKLASGYAKKRMGEASKKAYTNTLRGEGFGKTENDKSMKYKLNKRFQRGAFLASGKVTRKGLTNKKQREVEYDIADSAQTMSTTQEALQKNEFGGYGGDGAEAEVMANAGPSIEEKTEALRKYRRDSYIKASMDKFDSANPNASAADRLLAQSQAEKDADSKIANENGQIMQRATGYSRLERKLGSKVFKMGMMAKFAGDKNAYKDKDDFLAKTTALAASAGLSGVDLDSAAMLCRQSAASAGRIDIANASAGSTIGAFTEIVSGIRSGAITGDLTKNQTVLDAALKIQVSSAESTKTQDLYNASPKGAAQTVQLLAKQQAAVRTVLSSSDIPGAIAKLSDEERIILGIDSSKTYSRQDIESKRDDFTARELNYYDALASINPSVAQEFASHLGKGLGLDPTQVAGFKTSMSSFINSPSPIPPSQDIIDYFSSYGIDANAEFNTLQAMRDQAQSAQQNLASLRKAGAPAADQQAAEARYNALFQQLNQQINFLGGVDTWRELDVANMQRGKATVDQRRRDYNSETGARASGVTPPTTSAPTPPNPNPPASGKTP